MAERREPGAGRVPRHDIEAEQALLGAALISPNDVLPQVVAWVSAEDFYKPAHKFIWSAIAGLWAAGERIDAVTVHHQLSVAGVADDIGATGLLLDAQSSVPAISASARYALIVVNHAQARNVLAACGEAAQETYDPGSDPKEIADRLVSKLFAAVRGGNVLDAPDDLLTFDELIDLAVTQGLDKPDWMVAGLFGRDDRLILTAGEGVGKMVLLRQIVQLCAAGQHPLYPGYQIDRLTTLLVDAENPQRAIVPLAAGVRASLRRAGAETDGAWIWHRQAGIDLRSRVCRAELESVLLRVQPDLVAMGPLYKLFDRLPGETDEEAAKAVQAILDDVRMRYHFALLLEHHAPKGGKEEKRDLSPFGSSAWRRWPEYGIALRHEPRAGAPTATTVERWRPDRIPATWPEFIVQAPPPYLWQPRWIEDPRQEWELGWSSDDMVDAF